VARHRHSAKRVDGVQRRRTERRFGQLVVDALFSHSMQTARV
jgi:hypothetical protein